MPPALAGLQSESWPALVDTSIVLAKSPLPYSNPIATYAPFSFASILKGRSAPSGQGSRLSHFSLTSPQTFFQSSGYCLDHASTSAITFAYGLGGIAASPASTTFLASVSKTAALYMAG